MLFRSKSSLLALSVMPPSGFEPGLVKTDSDLNAIPASPRILIVEDSFLVLIGLEAMCTDLGWEIVGPATRVDQALALARSEAVDAALLDVNLDGEMSWEVADALKGRSIPFAFSTGYDQSNMLPERFAGTDVMAKPYRIDDVERRLRHMMAAAPASATA